MGHSEHLFHSHLHSINTMLNAPDPLQIAGFFAIFSYSCLVSLHCAGMCGPLACSVLGRQQKIKFSLILIYNTGRMLAYVTAGLIIGLLADGVAQVSLDAGRIVAQVAGSLLILAAIAPRSWLAKVWTAKSRPWLARYSQRLCGLSARSQAFGLGLITVFLPCMTLHPLLLASAGSGSILGAGLTLFAFFLGTVPIMITATYVPTLISTRLPQKMLNVLGRIMLGLAGLITIGRTF